MVAFPFRLIVFEEENGPNGGGLGFEGCERSEFCELGTCDVNSFCTIFADIWLINNSDDVYVYSISSLLLVSGNFGL